MRQNKNIFENLKKEIKPLEPGITTVYPPLTVEYFRYYGLQYDGAGHSFGSFRFRDYSIAAHIFLPRAYSSIALLMHGYLDHTGLLSGAIKHLLSKGCLVAAYDMPGHGLSSGEPSGIDSFSTYTDIMEEFLGMLKKNFKIPVNVIGHSTGGAAIIDYLLSKGGAGVEKVVLVSPLVRSYLWNVSKYSLIPLSYLVKSVPRVFRELSSDKAFVEFNRRDPLQNYSVPLGWVKALVEWNERVVSCKPCEKKILVLQGKKDTVVDWKYNMKFIGKKFPNAEIKYIENGNHHLLNEGQAIRSEVFNIIDTIS